MDSLAREQAFGQYLLGRSLVSEALLRQAQDVSADTIEALRDLASDAPAIPLVQRLITMAVDRKASDIHIEPTETAVKVRFRLDGVLQDIETLASGYASPIVSTTWDSRSLKHSLSSMGSFSRLLVEL